TPAARSNRNYHRTPSPPNLWLTCLLWLCLFAIQCGGSGYDPYVSYKPGARSYSAPGYGGGYADHGYHQPQQQPYHHQPYGIHDYPQRAPYSAPSYTPYRKYYKQYIPGPQYCPETGRTVCSKVAPFYPVDEVFSVVKMARAQRFNISSEFVD